MTTKIRGRHRRQGQRAAVMGALPIAIAISYSSVAVAAPQPGVTDEAQPDDNDAPSTAQPGVTPESDSDSDKAAPSTERTKESKPKSYWVAPPPEYNNVPTREVPTYYDYDEEEAQYVAPEPVQVQELHLPEPVAPVAPIEAPEEKLRIGDYVSDKPEWLSEEHMERTNNSAAVVEAQVATFWNSIGVETSRSDRLAAATTAGAVGGFVTGAAVCGVPAAVGGALVGGTIGGLTAGVGSIPTVVGPVLLGTIGTLGGGAIGAAAAGIPAAAVCGTVGGVIGGAAGANFGAGDQTISPTVEHEQGVAPILPEQENAPEAPEEKAAPEAPEAQAAPAPEAGPPVEVAPPAPGIDTQAITDGTRNVISQVETLPGGAMLVQDLRGFIDGPGSAVADDAEAVGNAVGEGIMV
ncbi:insoluble domain protein [Rhodococcus sp. NPDC058521]|uniref:insoluble domain protein n=1 Tax=Rhodococcus sp. NPDC058521 TaxID=3346536 RepID=UPI00364E14EE